MHDKHLPVGARQRGLAAPVIALILAMVAVMVVLAVARFGGETRPLAERVAVEPLVLQFEPRPVPLPAVTLTDTRGEPLGRRDFQGGWSLLYFGYTHCPDICPVELSALARLARLLREAPGIEPPQMVFVSVDPGRDTPESIGEYVRYFDSHIRGATADPEVLRELAGPLGVGWEKVPVPGMDEADMEDAYLINHYSSILLIDPSARLRAVFPAPHDPEKMADAYRQVIQAAEG